MRVDVHHVLGLDPAVEHGRLQRTGGAEALRVRGGDVVGVGGHRGAGEFGVDPGAAGEGVLLGLKDPEKMPEHSPWWLLLLRMTALAAAILAFAGPVLNPRPESSGAPLLVLLDGGWGDAPDWARRMDRAAAEISHWAEYDYVLINNDAEKCRELVHNILKAERLKARLSSKLPDVEIHCSTDIERTVRSADVLLTATLSREPLVQGAWLHDGQHITAVGADELIYGRTRNVLQG